MTRAPQRIALVLQSTAAGGMETHVIDLAHEYARRGIEVLAVVPPDASLDDVARRFAAPGIEVVRLNTDARDGRLSQLRQATAYVRLLRRFRPDAVHLHTGGATGGLAAIVIARLGSRAVVALTEHDVPVESPRPAQRAARIALDHAAHAVIAVSRRNAALRKKRIGVRCGVFAAVLNGVPPPSATSAERAADRSEVRNRHGIAADAVVVGSLVRLAPGKGIDDLIRAFALVRAKQPAKLLLVGDGPLREEAVALAASLGNSTDVIFAGSQAQPGLYLDTMDVFALAVPAGSMSIALLEAMARGLPPVITFGGPEEAVIDGESGLTANPNDPVHLASQISRLAADGAFRAALGARAAAHVRRHFSVARVADDLMEVYAAARTGRLPMRLRADGPLNPRPGDRFESVSQGSPGSADAA